MIPLLAVAAINRSMAKTDDGNLKKSHKGCCQVIKQADGTFKCYDKIEHWPKDKYTDLVTVFKDGQLTKYYNFIDIRRRMYD